MTAITHQDYETLLAVVGRLYECECIEQFERVALAEISKLVSCDHTTFNYFAPTIPTVNVLGLPDIPGQHAAREQAFAHYLTDQPILKHFLATGDARAYKFSDFLSVRQYHALPLYKHFYHELRYEDQFAFMLFPPGSELVAVGLARDRRSFTDRDRQILNLVRPYVASAYRHVERLGRLNRALHEGGAGCLNIRVTTVLLDVRDRPVRFASEAQEWISHFFPAQRRDLSCLPEAITSWLHRSRTNGKCATREDRSETMVREREGQSLRLRVIHGSYGQERIIILGRQIIPGAEHPSSASKLTRREIEVLQEVEQGRSNDETGLALGISSLTVRTHLEHIFKKLRVPCRTAAVTQFRRLCASVCLALSWLCDAPDSLALDGLFF
jgi:DNA-binding CsgD family transcriptional regulator